MARDEARMQRECQTGACSRRQAFHEGVCRQALAPHRKAESFGEPSEPWPPNPV